MKKIFVLITLILFTTAITNAQRTAQTDGEKATLEMNTLKTALDLTPLQVTKIWPLVSKYSHTEDTLKMQIATTTDAARLTTLKTQLANLIPTRNTAITPFLTSAQVTKLQAMLRRR